MPLEPDAEHVVGFALGPLGALPDRAGRSDPALGLIDLRAQTEAMMVHVRVQVIDHAEPGGRFTAGVLRIVHGRHVIEAVESQVGIISQIGQEFRDASLLADDRALIAVLDQRNDLAVEPLRQPVGREIRRFHRQSILGFGFSHFRA